MTAPSSNSSPTSRSKEAREHNPMRMAECTECGMHVGLVEYHPYAACLMFKQSRNSDTVRANLNAVVEYGKGLKP